METVTTQKQSSTEDTTMDKFLEELSKLHTLTLNPFTGRHLVLDELGQISVKCTDGYIAILSIESFNKGTGAGSAILKSITDVADKLGNTCGLGAKPFGRNGGLTKKELVGFYFRHGFEVETGPGTYGGKSADGILKYVLSKRGVDESVRMIRKPRIN